MSTGLALSRRFFEVCVAPVIRAARPELRYGAARMGLGSEVLGYDTEMSADHDYGPSLQIFLSREDFRDHGEMLLGELDGQLPAEFEGWQVHFPYAGRPSGPGERKGVLSSTHAVELYTLEAWYRGHFDADLSVPANALDWLGCSEQLLLGVTRGAVFRDDLGELAALRQRLAYYPRDVWLRRLAAQWARIAEEQAFVGRTGAVGDDLGSRIIAARLARDVMRLGFLIERQYAPYPKWIGTAFAELSCAAMLGPLLQAALAADNWRDREAALVGSYRHAAELQLLRSVPGAISPDIGPFFTRPFTVINADKIAAALLAAIEDPALKQLPLVGGIDQWADATPVLAIPHWSRAAMIALGPAKWLPVDPVEAS